MRLFVATLLLASLDAQHAHGPRSAQAKQAIEDVDKLLGELLAQLEQSPDWDRTLLVVVSDHGFAAIEQEIQLDVLLAPNAFSVANGGSGTSTRRTLSLARPRSPRSRRSARKLA